MRWNAGRPEFPLSSMPVWPACAVKDAHVRDKAGYDDVYHNSKNFCRLSRAPRWPRRFLARARGSSTRAVSRPLRTDVYGPGSELGRQIAVDLEADADLNEDRGCPGHWKPSLEFLNGNKVERDRPPRKRPARYGGATLSDRGAHLHPCQVCADPIVIGYISGKNLSQTRLAKDH